MFICYWSKQPGSFLGSFVLFHMPLSYDLEVNKLRPSITSRGGVIGVNWGKVFTVLKLTNCVISFTCFHFSDPYSASVYSVPTVFS